jgi:hypothetical protein
MLFLTLDGSQGPLQVNQPHGGPSIVWLQVRSLLRDYGGLAMYMLQLLHAVFAGSRAQLGEGRLSLESVNRLMCVEGSAHSRNSTTSNLLSWDDRGNSAT